MTLELVPWRGHTVPVLDGEISRYNITQYLTDLQNQFRYGGSQYALGSGLTTTYNNRPAEPISNSFEGFVAGMLYQDTPVAAVEQFRLRVFGQAPVLYQQVVDGRPGDLFDDPALDRLREPWPGSNLGDLMKRSLVHGDFAGNAFLVDLDDELVLLRPDWVEIILAKRMHRNGQVGWKQVGIVYYEGGLHLGDGVPFLPGEYAHFVPGLPDPLATYRGMSWLTPLVREVMADKAASDHKLAFFENAASPNLAVKLPKEITPQQFSDFVDKMDAQHKGALNAYKTLYTAGGADVTVIGANMQQMDFSAVQGKGETRVANAGGIPPVLLSFSEGMQGSSLNAGNYTAAKRNCVDTTMRDLWQNWCGSVQVMDRFRPPENARLWYDGRDIPFLHEDQKDAADIQQTKASTISTYITAGFEPDSAVASVDRDDRKLLKHTGLTSVQLVPPGSQDSDGDGVPDGEAAAAAEYEAELAASRSELLRARYGSGVGERIDAGHKGGGRFRKLSDRITDAIQAFLDGDGDGDPLPEGKFTQAQLRKAAGDLGLVQPRQRVTESQLKLLLLKHVRGDKKVNAKPDADKPEPKKAAPKAADPEQSARIRGRDLSRDRGVAARALKAGTDPETGEWGTSGGLGKQSGGHWTKDGGYRAHLSIAKEQGFDGKPRVLTAARKGVQDSSDPGAEEWRRLKDAGWRPLYRGYGWGTEGGGKTGEEMSAQYLYGPLHVGGGLGLGTNMSSDLDSADFYARKDRNTRIPGGQTDRFLLDPDAKVISYTDAVKMRDDYLSSLPDGREAERKVYEDPGTLAMARGFDAMVATEGDHPIVKRGTEEWVVLNRTAVVGWDDDPDRGKEWRARTDADREQSARDRQADIDSARQLATAAGELDEILHNGASDKAVLSRLRAAQKRDGVDLGGVIGAVERRREVEVENRVRAAYRKLVAERGESPDRSTFVGLADIRDELGEEYSRAEVDRVLRDMSARSGDPNSPGAVRLITTANTKALKQRDIDSAIPIPGAAQGPMVGGLHSIAMADASDRPVPDPRVEMDALLKSRGITPYGKAGDQVKFNRAEHEAIDGVREGASVQIVRPGHTLSRDGEDIRLSKSVVEGVDDPAPRTRKANKGSTIGDVVLGPTQLDVALGADVPSRFNRANFRERPLSGPDAAITHRGARLPEGFTSDRADIYKGQFAQRPGLTPEESRALDLYVLSSVADPLNTSLRSGNTTHGTATTRVRGHETVDLDEISRDLDSAIDAGELDEDTRLFRGAMMRPADVGKLQPGAITAESGYLSTSTERESAHQIVKWRQEKGSRGTSPVVFEILAPAGTHAAVAHVEENEVLLGRGRQMRVVDVLRPTRSGDNRVVTVELLPTSDGAPDSESTRDALDLKKVPELKQMLRDAGLPVSGRKRELVDRLVEHQRGSNASMNRPATAQQPSTPGSWSQGDTLTHRDRGPVTYLEPSEDGDDTHWVEFSDGDVDKVPAEVLTGDAPAAAATATRPVNPKSGAAEVMAGDFSSLRRVGKQGGANPGGIFEAPDGSRWYVKAQQSPQHAANEALASSLYRAAGIEAPEVIRGSGTPGLPGTGHTATRLVPDANTDLAMHARSETEALRKVHEGFAVDAWLANWDVAGENPDAGADNIVFTKPFWQGGGEPVRIDTGGALLYRGLGGPKGNAFGPVVTEWDVFREDSDRHSSKVFQSITPDAMTASARRVENIRPDQIRQLVADSGLPPSVADTLIARRKDILSRADALEARDFTRGAASGWDNAKGTTPVRHSDLATKASWNEALGQYQGELHEDINATLWAEVLGTSDEDPEVGQHIRRLDEAMRNSRLTQDVIVYRGDPDMARSLPQWSPNGGMEGTEWDMPAYSSTTVSEKVANDFAASPLEASLLNKNPTILRIRVPKGVSAISMDDPTNGNIVEQELLLDRGLRYRIVADHGVVAGVRRLDVEVVKNGTSTG